MTRVALLGSGLSPKEAALICVAWLPKATVQAAVGGAALDLMVENSYGAAAEARGRLVLMLSVLVILLTAPIGAIGIGVLGPKWLPYDGVPGASATDTDTTKEAPMTTEQGCAVLAVAPATAEPTIGEAANNGGSAL